MLNIVNNYNKIYILCHVSPDGDCLGSAFGLKEIIKDNFNKEAIVVSEESEYLSFLGQVMLPNNIDYSGSLVISVDTGSKERVCDKNFVNADYILRIDHHLFVDPFGTENYVVDTVGSCSEVITSYAIKNNLIVSKKAAFPLYTGIVTDTGRFSFRGVNEVTLKTAAFLLSTGLNASDVYEKLYVESIESLKFKSYIYGNIKETKNKVLYLYITKDIMEEYSLTEEETASYVSLMSGIKDRPIWVLFYDKGDVVRARIRSKNIAVNEVAAMFSGGGHAFASGATAKTKDEINKILDELDKLI